MRLWSLHPRYLDPRGLVALWREGLLARKVLLGLTVGYTRHPQLQRFRAHPDPLAAIMGYLAVVQQVATERRYAFRADLIGPERTTVSIPVTTGQLAYEWEHLKRKLCARHPASLERIMDIAFPESHPSFVVREGVVEGWERAALAPTG